HGNSEKCAAAREWGLQVVNHLWLEESYAKWKLQPVSEPRYTHFPKRTNLGEVVGQTRLDRSVLETLFFPSEAPPQTSTSTNKDQKNNAPMKGLKVTTDDTSPEPPKISTPRTAN